MSLAERLHRPFLDDPLSKVRTEMVVCWGQWVHRKLLMVILSFVVVTVVFVSVFANTYSMHQLTVMILCEL